MSEQAVENTVLDRFECRSCGYVYEPEKGDNKHDIAPETPFAELPIVALSSLYSEKGAFMIFARQVQPPVSEKISVMV